MRALLRCLLALLVLTKTAAAQARTDSVDLVVAATTDVHGRLLGWDYYENRADSTRGLSRVATIVDSVRTANPNRVILLDAGDLLEGNPLAYVAARVRPGTVHPVIAAMNAMHYDAAVVGDREFTYGLPLLRRAIGQAHFPFLAANAVLASGKPAFASWRIVRRAGVRVGIVGATTPGANLWDRDHLRGRLTIRDIVPAVQSAVRAARRAGADVIVVALHSGLDEPSSYDTVRTHLPSENVAARVAHDVSGIDLIVYGHSHREMADTVVEGVLLTQPENWATSVAVAHLELGRGRPTGAWTVSRKWSSLVRAVGHAESPAVVSAASAAHTATVRYVQTPAGRRSVASRADSAPVRDSAAGALSVRKEPPRLPVHVTLPNDPTARFVRLRIIATNDFHGALDPIAEARGAPRGGADAMAATIARASADCAPPDCAMLLVDAGDLFQGSAASNLAHGAPVVALYNALGYAATAIGNHEFDWGIDTLRARMREARFGILAANVRDAAGRPPSWARDDTILERGKLRIGIIGVIGPETYHSIMPARVRGLRFDDPAPIIDSLARSLRARGVDVVIVLAHSGAFCDDGGTTSCHGGVIDLASRLTEPVTAIISGHTHSLVDTHVDRVPIVQARSSGRAVAVLDLAIAPAAARDSVLSQVVLDARATGKPPRVADSIVRAADARVSGLERRPVARLAAPLARAGAQYPLGNLIADAQRWAGTADVAAVNNGGIRQELPAGQVTWGALFAVQPFGNTLRRLTVPGRALRDYLATVVAADGAPTSHVSGVTLTFDRGPGGPVHLASVRLAGGAELRDAARYTIVLNDFMATGTEGRILTDAATADETLASDDLEALVAYLSSRPQPVAAPNDTRITISHP